MNYSAIVWRALAKATTYRGRDSRSQFWLFTLTYWLLITAFLAVILAIDGNDDGVLAVVIVLLFGLVVLGWAWLAHLASAVRRLHDADISGGWALPLLIAFFPLLYVRCSLRGTQGENRFGHDPKLIAEEVARRRAAQVA